MNNGRTLGRLRVRRVNVGSAPVLRRTSVSVTRSDHPHFLLVLVREGQAWLRHRSGVALLRKDECVLLDSRDPHELEFGTGSDALSVELPIDWVEAHLPDPQVAVAVPLGAQQPWAGMLREVIETIAADPAPPRPHLLAENLCTALALTVDAIEVRATPHSRKTFKSLQQTLAELASTCHVTAAEIAQAHGVSLRYLHAIYSANGTSCGRELIRMRLERAQRLLLDPAESGRSIDDIAWQCGFSDASHFRRRFREQFGVPPSAMRAESGVAQRHARS